MNWFHLAAAAALLSFVGGIVVVNIAATPRAAQIGTIMAGCGVVTLAVIAIRQLLAYVKSLAVGCAAMLGFSGALFCADKAIPGWFTLGGALLIAISTIRSWKNYQQNCDRKAARNGKEES